MFKVKPPDMEYFVPSNRKLEWGNCATIKCYVTKVRCLDEGLLKLHKTNHDILGNHRIYRER